MCSSIHWFPTKSVLEDGVHGLTLDDVSADSTAVAAKLHLPPRDERPLVTPVYHTSTYIVKSVDHYLDILKNVSS